MLRLYNGKRLFTQFILLSLCSSPFRITITKSQLILATYVFQLSWVFNVLRVLWWGCALYLTSVYTIRVLCTTASFSPHWEEGTVTQFKSSDQLLQVPCLLLTCQHLHTVWVCLVIINILYHWLYPSVACYTLFCFWSSLKPPLKTERSPHSVSPFLPYSHWLQRNSACFSCTVFDP